MLFMYIYLMFLIMMGTHFSQSFLQLFSDSIQILIGFISIKNICIKCIYYKCIYGINAFNPQMHLTHKCIYSINAFIPQMHLYKCICHKCIFITINLSSKASDFGNYFNVLFIIYYILAFNFI